MINIKIRSKLTSLLRSLALLLILAFPARSVSAQEELWPPFWFDLIPAYENGQLTYTLNLYRRVEWSLPDLTINVPLPAGTRFLESNTQAGVNLNFDGQEVILSAPTFDRYIEGVSFTVEVTDPALTVFTTQAHITWQGEQPGSYLAEAVSFDTTRPALNWQPLPDPRLQLGLSATIAGDVITYALYPKAVGRPRMWDLRINIPIPPGATFIAAEAPPPFTSSFDGHEASFFILELTRQTEVEPLILKVSLTDASQPALVTRAQATWKNSSRDAGAVLPAEESLLTDDLTIQPQLPQQAMLDAHKDVPLPNYDVTSLVFQPNGAVLNIIFNMAGPVGPSGQPIQNTLFIDSDCYSDTGQKVKFRGAEYRLRYNHETGRASFVTWDSARKDWNWDQPTPLDSQVREQTVQISMPYQLLGTSQQFCWIAQTSNNSEEFNLALPRDWVPNGEHWHLTEQKILPTPTLEIPNEEHLNLTEQETVPTSTLSVVPTPPNISGKLAVPLKNERGLYDVYIFSLPSGQELARIPNAHQPNFRDDGAALLTTHESAEAEQMYEQEFSNGGKAVYIVKTYKNIYEYDLTTRLEKPIGDDAPDAYPAYNPWVERIMSGNSQPRANTASKARPLALPVQCNVLQPGQATETRCQNLADFGLLAGSQLVWSDTTVIVYSGCPNQASESACGIYLIDPGTVTGSPQAAAPVQLTSDPSDVPSDARDLMIAFTSKREGNWEAYLINVDGTGLINLSQDVPADDGLPTFSPDGDWLAFISNRGGQWAIWAMPVTGGPVRQLFNLPVESPWDAGDPTWLNERISWGK